MSTASDIINQVNARGRESVSQALDSIAGVGKTLVDFRLRQENDRLARFITEDNLRWLASGKVQDADVDDMDAILIQHKQEQQDALAGQGFDKMTIARYSNVVGPASFRVGGDFYNAYTKIKNDKVFYAGKSIFDDELSDIMNNRQYTLAERQAAIKSLYESAGVKAMPFEYQAKFTPEASLLHQAEQMQALTDMKNDYEKNQNWEATLGKVDTYASKYHLNDGEKQALIDQIYAFRDKTDERTVSRGATLLADLAKSTNEAYSSGYKVTPEEAKAQLASMPAWWQTMYGQTYVDTVGAKYNAALSDDISQALVAGDYSKATEIAGNMYGNADKVKELSTIALKQSAVAGGLASLQAKGISDFDELIVACDKLPIANDQSVTQNDVKRYIAFEYAKHGNQKAAQYLKTNGSYVPFIVKSLKEITGTKTSSTYVASAADGNSSASSSGSGGKTITTAEGNTEVLTDPEHIARVVQDQEGWVWDERLQQKVHYDGIGTMFGTADGCVNASLAEIDPTLSDDDYQAVLSDLFRKDQLSLAQYNHFADKTRSKLSSDPRVNDLFSTLKNAAETLYSDDAFAKKDFIEEAKVATRNAIAVDPNVLADPEKLEGLKTLIRSIGADGAMRSLSDAAGKVVPKAVKDNLGAKSVSGFMQDVADGKYKLFIDYRIFDKALTDTAFTSMDGSEYKGIGLIDWIMSRGNTVDTSNEIENFVVQSIASGTKLEDLTEFQQAQVKATSALIAVACAAGRQFRQDFGIKQDAITGVQRVGEGFAFLVDPDNHIYARVSDYMSYGDSTPGASYELFLPDMTYNSKGQYVPDFASINPNNVMAISGQVDGQLYGEVADKKDRKTAVANNLRSALDIATKTKDSSALPAMNRDWDRAEQEYRQADADLADQKERISSPLTSLQSVARTLLRKHQLAVSQAKQRESYNAYKGDNQ